MGLFGPSYTSSRLKSYTSAISARIRIKRNNLINEKRIAYRELATLVTSGDITRAKIKVETVTHKIRILYALDILEIYAELITARIPQITSAPTSTPPPELTTAMASLAWAAVPARGLLPELAVIREQLGAKFGTNWLSQVTGMTAGPVPDAVQSRLRTLLTASPPTKDELEVIWSEVQEQAGNLWEPDIFDTLCQTSVPDAPEAVENTAAASTAEAAAASAVAAEAVATTEENVADIQAMSSLSDDPELAGGPVWATSAPTPATVPRGPAPAASTAASSQPAPYSDIGSAPTEAPPPYSPPESQQFRRAQELHDRIAKLKS